MDIETAAGILKEICACLGEAQSHGFTDTLVCEALQAGKCWDNIHLKLCNANIHTYTSYFIEIPKRDKKYWQPMCIISKQKPKCLTSMVTPLAYALLSRVSRMHIISQQRSTKRTHRPYKRSSNWWRSSTQHNRLQLPCHPLW